MTAEAHFDPEQIGTATVEGVEYEVWANQGIAGFAQLAWIARAGVIVATVIGFVRGEPRVRHKEPGLAWSDASDSQAAASVESVWAASDIVRVEVSSR